MNPNFKEFQDKFRVEEMKIYENDSWVWSLRPVHCTIGAGILSGKPYAERLSEINEKSGQDFAKIIKVIEHTLKKTFSYNKINYLMLMMVDLHIHYHVVPRYSREIDFSGITWKDSGWPALPELGANQVDDDNILFLIRDHLIENLVL